MLSCFIRFNPARARGHDLIVTEYVKKSKCFTAKPSTCCQCNLITQLHVMYQPDLLWKARTYLLIQHASHYTIWRVYNIVHALLACPPKVRILAECSAFERSFKNCPPCAPVPFHTINIWISIHSTTTVVLNMSMGFTIKTKSSLNPNKRNVVFAELVSGRAKAFARSVTLVAEM